MTAQNRLLLGSRDSALALAQTNMVAEALKQRWPQLEIEIHTFKTQGDLILDKALSKAGDKGLFVKELEVALLAGEIDLAVHSMKDLPGDLPPDLALLSFSHREDPRDVMLGKTGQRFFELPPGAIIGTSSLRREAQLRRLRSDLNFEVIRGNLLTRYRKLQDGPYDAIILAAAGVHRLGWKERITQYFDPWEETIPAVAQGILGVEYRATDDRVLDYIAPLSIKVVEVAREAERAVLAALSGGCQLPLGAYCRVTDDVCEMKGVVLSVDGQEVVYAQMHVDMAQPAESGRALATVLLDQGAREILQAIRQPIPVDAP
jgi:hydroxymethylbilane synthase